MSKRVFYKTTYVVEVLSEEPVPELTLAEIYQASVEGPLVLDIKSEETVEVDGKTMVGLLEASRCHAEYFSLNREGVHEADT